MPDAWIPQTNSFLAGERKIWLWQAWLCKKLPCYWLSLPALAWSEEAEKPHTNYWIEQSWQTPFTHRHTLLFPLEPLSDQGSCRQTVLFRHTNGERKDYFIQISFFLAARDGALCTPDKAQNEVGVVCVCHAHWTGLAKASQIVSWSRVYENSC